jgi:hypothetical protein
MSCRIFYARAPPPLWKRVLCVIGAVILFALGIVGWLIPVVTGIPFYALGLVLLGISSQRVREWINHAERRLPSTGGGAFARPSGGCPGGSHGR